MATIDKIALEVAYKFELYNINNPKLWGYLRVYTG